MIVYIIFLRDLFLYIDGVKFFLHMHSICCEMLVRNHTNEKTKMCGAKGSGNPRFKCLQATTHTRAKTMTQTLTKHRDKQA